MLPFFDFRSRGIALAFHRENSGIVVWRANPGRFFLSADGRKKFEPFLKVSVSAKIDRQCANPQEGCKQLCDG